MLIFDFDGVLINSLDEVTLTVYNATTAKMITSLAALPRALIEMFQRNRFHVQSIGDAILLMNRCLNNYRSASAGILNPEEYQSIITGAAVSITARTNRVYKARSRFIEKDQTGWSVLHQPYQPLWNELIRRDNTACVILTNKNHDATLRLCRHFGLSLTANNIYSGDQGATKLENMRAIQNRFRTRSFAFIDDSVKNLRELDIEFNRDEKMLSLLFATWGYTGPEDEKIAQKYGYPVLKQTDLNARLKKDARRDSVSERWPG